jgi:acyl carrier protein
MSCLKDLQDLIHEKYGVTAEQLDPHASIRATGIDSLALVEFLFAIEDRYGISLPDENSNIDTLADLASVVDRLVAARKTLA